MVVIVGAGISGLTLAHELDRRGADFVVLEASPRVGGAIRSGRIDGRVVEFGPQRARMTRDFAALVDELGLRGRMTEAPAGLPLFVYRGGGLRRVPFSARELAATDLLTPSEKARLLAEPLTRAVRPDESVGDALRRKVGRGAYEALAGPLYGGLYGSDPDDMLVRLSLGTTLRELGVGRSLVLPLLRRDGRIGATAAVTFADGLEELPRALHERHREHVRMSTPVRTIRRRARGFVVETDDGAIDAAHVVVTSPARATADLLRGIDEDAAARVRALVYNPLALVHLHATAELRGLGYQVAFGERLVTRGVTFNDALFDRRGVYTAFLGGASNAWVAERDDDEIGRLAVEEFRAVTGAAARVLSVGRAAMPAWDGSWRALDRLRLPDGLHLHANWSARPGLPGRLAGSRRLAERLAGSAD